MTHWVALLRGVNVGGHNKVPMADLRALAGRLGWHDVRSYIASGNLVFQAEGDAEDLAESLRAAMVAQIGVDVPVLVLPGPAIHAAVADCPFQPEKGSHVHAFFLWSAPVVDAPLLTLLRAPSEALIVRGGIAWLHAPEGVGRSKLAEKIGKVIGSTEMTGRNLNTVVRLAQMLEAGIAKGAGETE